MVIAYRGLPLGSLWPSTEGKKASAPRTRAVWLWLTSLPSWMSPAMFPKPTFTMPFSVLPLRSGQVLSDLKLGGVWVPLALFIQNWTLTFFFFYSLLLCAWMCGDWKLASSVFYCFTTSVSLSTLFWFFFFKTGFSCEALAVLELSCWPQTHRDSPTSASQMLELNSCTILPGSSSSYFIILFLKTTSHYVVLSVFELTM